MRVEFHPAAAEELETSAEWYANHDRAVARDFLVAVDLAIQSIASDPERFALLEERYRSCSVSGFPYQIVFEFSDDRLTILAIAHAKRRPNYWRGRSRPDA